MKGFLKSDLNKVCPQLMSVRPVLFPQSLRSVLSNLSLGMLFLLVHDSVATLLDFLPQNPAQLNPAWFTQPIPAFFPLYFVLPIAIRPQISKLILENSFSTGLLAEPVIFEPVTLLHAEVCTTQVCDFPWALRNLYQLCYNLVYSVKAFSIPDR